MKHTTYGTSGALLAAAALLLTGAAPAAAQAAKPGNWLFLTVSRGDTRSAEMRGTLLLCDPPRGGHARADEACTQLAAADGDFTALPSADALCPMVYAPVTVRARGEWAGQTVDYRQTYSNRCVMAARTGAVFALDT